MIKIWWEVFSCTSGVTIAYVPATSVEDAIIRACCARNIVPRHVDGVLVHPDQLDRMATGLVCR